MSQDFDIDDNFDDDEAPFDDPTAKVSAKESLEKRRLIDDLLSQRRLQRELEELDYDIDDDFDDD